MEQIVVMDMDRPFRYSLDGEMFTGQHLTASIGPVVEIALI